MSANSKIEWCDHTFNPWIGCTKVSPGCDHCYAEAHNARFDGGVAVNWGPGAPRRRTSPATWSKPLAWDRAHAKFFAKHGRRQRVFCASLADVFDNEVPSEWRDDLATLIAHTPDLDWLLLTKRIGNAGAMLGDIFLDGPPDNLWLGATIVTQEEADRDIPKLLAVPAAKRFLSIEPLLGPVDLTMHLWGRPKPCDDCPKDGDCECGYARRGTVFDDPALDWVIVGGESGPKARPMHPDWARSLREQCAAAGVPFLFKQWGEWMPPESRTTSYPDGDWRDVVDATGEVRKVAYVGDRVLESSRQVVRVGKKAAGRLLDGIEHNGFPA